MAPPITKARDGFQSPVRTEAPGMLESHYSPGVPVEVFDAPDRLRERAVQLEGACVLLVPRALPGVPCRESISLGEGAAMAVALFSTLRHLDNPTSGRILALVPPPEGLGLAVRDRLFRAARSRLG